MLLHGDITNEIIKAFYKVYNKLGYGFLEKVYVNSMIIELQKLGLKPVKQVPISVYYFELPVGEYFADIIVNDTVIIEIKAAENIAIEHEYQLLNYLKATNKEVGILLNFGTRPALKRKIFTNDLRPPPLAEFPG